MTITFSCEHCGKSLTTTDDKAGRQAKCPGCGELIVVPAAEFADAVLEEENLPSAPVPHSKTSNGGVGGTKTCPMCGATNPSRAKSCQACGEELEADDEEELRRGKGTLEVGDVISSAWSIYMKELGIVLGSVLIGGIVSNIASGPSVVVGQINAFQREQGQQPPPAMDLLYISLLIPAQLFALFLHVGVTKILFKVARGKSASLGEIFSGGKYFLRMLGSSLLFGLMLLGGLLACILPMFLVFLMFWPFTYVLIDEDPPGVRCLWRAKEITQGSWGSAIVLFLAVFGINLLGLMACCVGLIFTGPFTQLILAVAYCRMSAQRTAE